MGSVKKYPPVKLVFGLIYKNENILQQACSNLERRFGKLDFLSQPLDFNYTDYYQKEFGAGLKRKFVSAGKLIRPDDLAKIKTFTNKLEKKFSHSGCRLINIDPGCLDLSKFILATTKDFFHRIYLSRGIFAELTLFFQDKTFKALDWTYPDYRTAEYIAILKQIREIYALQLKNKKI